MPPDEFCHSSCKSNSMHVNCFINKPYQQTLLLLPSSPQRTRQGNDSSRISEEPIGSEYPAAPQTRHWPVPRSNAVAALAQPGGVQGIIQSQLQALYRNFRVTISFWTPMYILHVSIKWPLKYWLPDWRECKRASLCIPQRRMLEHIFSPCMFILTHSFVCISLAYPLPH